MESIKVCMMVDDDVDDQELFEIALSNLSKETELITVNNGCDALDYLKKPANKIPDIIFLDLNMPKMGGKECLKELKSDSALREIPVVIFSTSSDNRDKEEVINIGAMDFISKPPRISELTSMISIIFNSLQKVKD